MRSFLLALFFLAFAAGRLELRAADLQADSVRVGRRSFSKEALRDYSRDADFQYTEKGRDLTPSLWQRFWAWFWSLFRFKAFSVGTPTFWKWFVTAVASAIVLFAVLKLKGMDPFALLRGNARSIDLPYEEKEEDIHQMSFDEEIRAAVEGGNYRLAIRMLYLKSLKRLHDHGRIQWAPGKTNWAYVTELRHQEQRWHFQRLTTQFEYAWYGDFPVDRQLFERVSHSFENFNKGVFR